MIKFLQSIPLGYRIIASVFIVLICPWLLTRHGIGYFDFKETGQIGDTIGGLTAPAIGLLNAWLLFITLKRQDEQTKLQAELFREQRRYDDYDRRIDLIRNIIQSIHFSIRFKGDADSVVMSVSGNEAFIKLSAIFRNMQEWELLEDLDLKQGELDLMLYKIMDIINEVITILNQNKTSKRSAEEKIFIRESVLHIISFITDVCSEAKLFFEKSPTHPFIEALLVRRFLVVKIFCDKFEENYGI